MLNQFVRGQKIVIHAWFMPFGCSSSVWDENQLFYTSANNSRQIGRPVFGSSGRPAGRPLTSISQSLRT